MMEKFLWWLTNEAELSPTLAALSPLTIRAFLTYAREPRLEGRYGSHIANARGEARPSTVDTYYRALRAFASFCLAEGLLDDTPLKNVRPPRIPKDQLPPLTQEQIQKLVEPKFAEGSERSSFAQQ
jgi:integrase